MNETHQEVVVDMISRSFAEKGDLTTLAQVTYNDLFDQVSILWESLLEANLSFVIIDSSREEGEQIIGACLNFDARSAEAEPLCACSAFERANVGTETKNEENGKEIDEMDGEKEDDDKQVDIMRDDEVPMSVVEFLQAVEEPLKDEHLPDALGKTIYTSLLGTSSRLSPADNVKVFIIFIRVCYMITRD